MKAYICICYRTVKTAYGKGAAVCYAADGEPVTRLDAGGVWPLDTDGQSGVKSARYARPDGLVIPLADAIRLGLRKV